MGSDDIGAHILFDWGTVSSNKNIDVVNVGKKGVMFGPSPMWTGACGSNPPDKIWDWMSYDWDEDGVNGVAMIDGPFQGLSANFNLMGVPPVNPCNENNACTIDTCDPASGCVYTPVTCGAGETCDPADGICQTSTGADVDVLQFLLPRHVDNCDNKQKIVIVARNFSQVPASGTIQLKKDGVQVKEWANVNFKKRRAIVKFHLYNPAGDGGTTSTWHVDIIVPGNPNTGNNSSTKTMTVDTCNKHSSRYICIRRESG